MSGVSLRNSATELHMKCSYQGTRMWKWRGTQLPDQLEAPPHRANCRYVLLSDSGAGAVGVTKHSRMWNGRRTCCCGEVVGGDASRVVFAGAQLGKWAVSPVMVRNVHGKVHPEDHSTQVDSNEAL